MRNENAECKNKPRAADERYIIRDFAFLIVHPSLAFVLFVAAEETAERGFIAFGLLLDLELAEDRVPADVNLVPLVFEVALGAFVQLAEETQGRGIADEGVDVLLAGGGDLDAGKDHFEFLDEHAL